MQNFFLKEISPISMRGEMGFFSEMAFVINNLFGMILGMSTVLGNHLLYLVGFSIIPTLISIIMIYPLHETPKFLLLKKKDRFKATNAIKFYIESG